MQDAGEERALDREFEPAIGEQGLDDRLAAGLPPQPLEDQGRPDAPAVDREALASAHGGQHQRGFAQPPPGLQQLVELAGLQPIFGAAQRGDNMLADGAVRAPAVDDLQVATRPNGFAAEEHAHLGNALRMCRIFRIMSIHLCTIRGTTFPRNFRLDAPQTPVIPGFPSRQPHHNC